MYKVELCFLAGVHPLTPVAAVPDLPAIVAKAKLLLEANKDRPTASPQPTADAATSSGSTAAAAPACAAARRSRRSDQGPPGQERVTYWCPTCQPRRLGFRRRASCAAHGVEVLEPGGPDHRADAELGVARVRRPRR